MTLALIPFRREKLASNRVPSCIGREMGAAVGVESLLPTLGAQQREEKEENPPVYCSDLWRERKPCEWAEQRGGVYGVLRAGAELV